MFGLEDKYVAAVYVLCILSSLLCVAYGIINWNKGDDSVKSEDIQWAKHEKAVEEKL